MIVVFKERYLKELYTEGKSSDKKHRYQPQIVLKYIRIIDLMVCQDNVLGLMKYGSLHYEHLHGDKEGISSVRVNDQYRMEFVEENDGQQEFATIIDITELSKHYSR